MAPGLGVARRSSSSRLARPKSVILGVPSRRQQDVGRLEVAVDDAAAGGRACMARASVSTRAGRALARRLRRAGELLRQAAAVDELQGEEGPAVVLADLVDLHDVGVLQAGDGLGLGAEAGQFARRRRARRPGSS